MLRWTCGILCTIALVGCASSGSGAGGQDRNVIPREEIISSSATTAYDLVQGRRPHWLRARGMQSLQEQGQIRAGGGSDRSVSTTPGQTQVIVYLDNARMGGVEELRQIPAAQIRYVRYLDAAAATQRWGGGHSHGAILVAVAGQD